MGIHIPIGEGFGEELENPDTDVGDQQGYGDSTNAEQGFGQAGIIERAMALPKPL